MSEDSDGELSRLIHADVQEAGRYYPLLRSDDYALLDSAAISSLNFCFGYNGSIQHIADLRNGVE